MMLQEQFTNIVQLIKQSRAKAVAAVNMEMINLYRNIGQYIHSRVETQRWRKSVVRELADFCNRYIGSSDSFYRNCFCLFIYDENLR